MHLLQGRVSKDDYTCPRFLVNEEHAGAKPVRCGPEAGLGVHILRPTLFEVLVCVGKLAGSEPLTSAGCYDNARHGQEPITSKNPHPQRQKTS